MSGFDFIVNPASGHGRARKLWHIFENARGGLGADRIHWTKYRGHAQEIASQLQHEQASCVVAIGGDGLLNEVVNGLFSTHYSHSDRNRNGAHAIGLAHLPAGSGCDFARHFGIPRDPRLWQNVLDVNNRVTVDVGKVTWTSALGESNSRFFVTLAMAGIAGDIAETMDRWGKPLGGFLSYLLVSLQHLLVAQPKEMTLQVDGEHFKEDKYHLVTLANTATTAGMRIAPDADAGDGVFDLILVRGVSRARLLWNFASIYKGTHLNVSGVEHRKVKCLTIESNCQEVRMNIDGEPLGRLPACFQVIPGALELVVPGASYPAL